jgi:hypothetical protein
MDPAIFLTLAMMVMMMRSRRFGRRMLTSRAGCASTTQSLQSARQTVTKASDILAFRKFLFDSLGYYSFPLRLGPQERKMLTPEMITTLEANEEEFRTTYTTSSFHLLQQDIYLALKKLLSKSIMLSR